MWNRSSILLLVLLLANPVLPRRASAGGGSFPSRGGSAARGGIGSRGSSGSRGGFGGPRTNIGGGRIGQPGGGFQPGGVQPGAGGFRPPPNQGGGFGGGVRPGGFPNQGGFHPQGGSSGGFRPGTGPGSAASSGTFKKALLGGALGAVGGLVAFEAGKAIIQSATRPFNHDGRNYYFDNNAQVKNNEIMCSMPLSQLQQVNPTTTTTTAAPGGESTVAPASTTPSPDQLLNTLQFADGTRPKTITWTCKRGAEVCCGTDCCPAPPQNNMAGGPNHAGSTGSNVAGIAIGILLLLLLSCCCCCFLAYKCCRSAFDGIIPQSNKQDEVQQDPYSQQYPMQQYPASQGYPQSYPANQGYPSNQGYPQQGGGYPQQGYSQAYPPQPTY